MSTGESHTSNAIHDFDADLAELLRIVSEFNQAEGVPDIVLAPQECSGRWEAEVPIRRVDELGVERASSR